MMFGHWKNRHESLLRVYKHLEGIRDTLVGDKIDLAVANTALKQDNAVTREINSNLRDDIIERDETIERLQEIADQELNDARLEIDELQRQLRLVDGAEMAFKGQIVGLKGQLEECETEAVQLFKRTELLEGEVDGWRSRANKFEASGKIHKANSIMLANAIDNLWNDTKPALDEVLGEKL